MIDKVRVQLMYDTAEMKVSLRLTDQDTNESITANIDPHMAMTLGDQMFKVGANMKAGAGS